MYWRPSKLPNHDNRGNDSPNDLVGERSIREPLFLAQYDAIEVPIIQWKRWRDRHDLFLPLLYSVYQLYAFVFTRDTSTLPNIHPSQSYTSVFFHFVSSLRTPIISFVARQFQQHRFGRWHEYVCVLSTLSIAVRRNGTSNSDKKNNGTPPPCSAYRTLKCTCLLAAMTVLAATVSLVTVFPANIDAESLNIRKGMRTMQRDRNGLVHRASPTSG